MQIILKQRDIEQALKGYMTAQGINLFNKEVTVQFSAGRGANGISAEVNIEDAPGALQPAATLLRNIADSAPFVAQAAVVTPIEPATLPVDMVEAAPELEAEPEPQAPEAEPEQKDVPPAPSGSSLFS